MPQMPKQVGETVSAGYTTENLANDNAAAIAGLNQSSVLDTINSDISQSQAEIQRLTAEMATISANPSLIPVPTDAQINPLAAIGATLRAIGGDSSSLDGLLQRKQAFADYQRQVEAQNVMLQNAHRRQQHENILSQLTAQRDKVEKYELMAAGIVDQEADDAEARRMAAFETRVGQLEHLGIGDVDAIINDYPQEYRESGYTPDGLRALKRQGWLAANPPAPVAGDEGSAGMFAFQWEQAYGESFNAQIQELAAGGLAEADRDQLVEDAAVNISLIESKSEGGRNKRQQYLKRLESALMEGGMADEEARKAAAEAAAKAAKIERVEGAPIANRDQLEVLAAPFLSAGRFLERNFDNPFTGIGAALGIGQE